MSSSMRIGGGARGLPTMASLAVPVGGGHDRLLAPRSSDEVGLIEMADWGPELGGSIEWARWPWSPGTTSSMVTGDAAGTRRPSK